MTLVSDKEVESEFLRSCGKWQYSPCAHTVQLVQLGLTPAAMSWQQT